MNKEGAAVVKSYLVTGGAGFIGSNFIIYMLKEHPHIHIVNVDLLTYAGNLENLQEVENDTRYSFVRADICDAKAIRKVFEEYRIDYVINFAAESHVDRSILDPGVFAKTNVQGTINLLDIAKSYWQIGDDIYRDDVRFVQISTDEVYGSLGSDDSFKEKTPLDPHSPYSASKAGADMFVKAYYDTYKLPVNITRCTNNYGPYQHPEKLIPLMINNCLQHKPLPIYGDGMQVRDWLHVKDHCIAIDQVLKHGKVGETYNIGGCNEHTNKEIVQIIIDYVHDNVDDNVDKTLIKYIEDRKGHDRRYAIDPGKIQRHLGWSPSTGFEAGIKDTIQWYLEHQNWLDNIIKGTYREYYDIVYKGK